MPLTVRHFSLRLDAPSHSNPSLSSARIRESSRAVRELLRTIHPSAERQNAHVSQRPPPLLDARSDRCASLRDAILDDLKSDDESIVSHDDFQSIPTVQISPACPSAPGDLSDSDICEENERRQKKRGIFPKAATSLMRTWLFQHLNVTLPNAVRTDSMLVVSVILASVPFRGAKETAGQRNQFEHLTSEQLVGSRALFVRSVGEDRPAVPVIIRSRRRRRHLCVAFMKQRENIRG